MFLGSLKFLASSPFRLPRAPRLGSPPRTYAPCYVHEHGPLTRKTGRVIRIFAQCEISKTAWIH
eukprot:5600273-Pyramimonas_sp.AAC.1